MKYEKIEFPNQQVCCEVHINGLSPFMAWTEDLDILNDENIKEFTSKQSFVAYLATKGYSIEDRPYKNGLYVYWLCRVSSQHVGQQEF